MAQSSLTIFGRISALSRQQPLAGLRVEAQHDRAVASAITDAEGLFTITFEPSHSPELFTDDSPEVMFTLRVFDRDNRLLQATQASVPRATAGSGGPITLVLTPSDEQALAVDTSHRVQGRIVFDNGWPAANVVVRLYSVGFGGVRTRLGETVTDAQGLYALAYNAADAAVHLAVRVDAGGQELPVSHTKFHAAPSEVLHLVIPATVQPLAAEYDRLTADLTRQLGAPGSLRSARENDAQHDLTFLHAATGWDARLIALVVTANTLSPETGMPQDVLYALFRTGLPTDTRQLGRVSVTAVGKALGKARQAGIIALTDQQITAATDTFAHFARQSRRAETYPGALSSVGELLDQSGLTEAEKNLFEQIYCADHRTSAELWERARQQGIPEKTITALQLQGKLTYLTLNNALLSRQLQDEIGAPANLAALVDKDLYQPETWQDRLRALAGNDEQALAKLIPPAYTGPKTTDRLAAYAHDMARKVRRSFPTQVVARMIEHDDLRLGDTHDTVKPNVRTFLNNAGSLGFELGRVPIDAFITQHRDKVFQRIAPADVQATTQQIKQLQRLYQITPTDESLQVLYDLGFKSAHDVASVPYDVFMERFGGRFRSTQEAELVCRKAQQVSAVAYNLVTAAKQLDTSPVLYAMSPPAAVLQDAKNTLIKHYPTLESLFGSLDFCECEHCRSVLSPAAYFVDLLQFLDPDEATWNGFLQDWKAKHNNEDYTLTYAKPYDALIERRPDLPHLPLTCENTNTTLPYIDVVNEILEYSVAKGKLEPAAVHDTGQATTPELLAEPHNVLTEAYDALETARYPLGLPFDLWLETVRQFYDHFATPLWQVLDTFRPADALFPPAVNPKPYYRADVFVESLGMSPAEYAIFTDPNPLDKWHELYGGISPDEAPDALKFAKPLARVLGVSYKELFAVVRTSFVNPQRHGLGILHKLGVDTSDVFRYKGHAAYPPFTQAERVAFEAKLDGLTHMFQTTGFNARTWLETTWVSGGLNKVLLLVEPASSRDFDQTTLHYADGTPADALVFLRINLFVRLWRKLGWTIEETDQALHALLPREETDQAPQALLPRNALPPLPPPPLPPTGLTIGEALKTALVYLAHLKTLDAQVKIGKNSRLKLLTFWSNLATTGDNPLYAQLFLTSSMLRNDPVFDDPLGQYLSQPRLLLKDHMPAIQGALSLTADEVDRILTDAGQNLPTAVLSLDNVSLLYRYGLLAKALTLPIQDMIALKSLSGLDPFKPLHAGSLTTLDMDYPFMQTLRFVELATRVQESGFQIADLDYLLRHRFDPVGPYREHPEALLALVQVLSGAIQRVKTEHAVPADPAALTDAFLQQKLALILPPDVVETFLGMWTGTVEYEAVQEKVAPANQLAPEAFAQEPAIQVSYDAAHRVQRLTCKGVLVEAQKAQLIAAHPAPLLASLLDAVQAQAQAFFATYLQKTAADGFVVGFLEQADFELLFGPVPEGLSDAQEQEQQRQKRAKLAEAFLPVLQQKLLRQLMVEALATGLGADPALTEALLTSTSLLTDPSQPDAVLLEGFTAAGDQGVTAVFTISSSTTESQTPAKRVESVDTTGKPRGADGAKLHGYFEVPVAGTYRFCAVLEKQDATVALRIDPFPDALMQGTAVSDNTEMSAVLELKAGVPYHFTFEALHLGGGDAFLLVQGENLPQGRLGRLRLYPAASVERVRRAYVLLAKTIQLIQGLGLREREVRYLLTHAADFDHLDLSKLPTSEGHASPIAVTELFKQFLRLAEYARLKRDIAGETDDLISIFEHARRTYPSTVNAHQVQAAMVDDLCQRFARLTRRAVDTVQATATQLGFVAQSFVTNGEMHVHAPHFTQEQGIHRLWEALQVVETLGMPVTTIVRSTDVISPAITPAERFAIAQEVRNTVKARYEPDSWQRIAQPIFDRLRQRQRDALVAFILHRNNFEHIEQLFEYFLIDPGMEPVVQTSRVRLAIAAVQTFIQRCLLNLEPKVPPSVINAAHWEWMRRYRVWEANRKIFLFPENWLEPEFRDDKTHLFQELESTLLQSDVSNDLAEEALFTYLKKLQELARLDIVAMCGEENLLDTTLLDPALNVLHVIGRTHTLPYKYFYRRYADDTWTPWEPVTAEIEGDHLAAIVWQSRLHLFWVTFLEKSVLNPPVPDDPVNPDTKLMTDYTFTEVVTASVQGAQKEVEVQLNWSEYFQGQWTPRASSGFGDSLRITVGNSLSSFDNRQVFISAFKGYEKGEESAVKIHLKYPKRAQPGAPTVVQDGTFRIVSKISQPEMTKSVNLRSMYMPYNYDDDLVNRYYFGLRGELGSLIVRFYEQIKSEDGEPPFPTMEDRSTKAILGAGSKFSLVICNDLLLFTEEDLSNTFPTEDQMQEWGLRVAEPRVLRSPFFYQDNKHTFFVEPTLIEITVSGYDAWSPTPLPAEPQLQDDDWWKNIPVESQVPVPRRPFPDPIDPLATFTMRDRSDWLTDPATVFQFDGTVVGLRGGVSTPVSPSTAGVGTPGTFPGITLGSTPGALEVPGVETPGVAILGSELIVIGSGGLNAASLNNLKARRTSNPTRGVPGGMRASSIGLR